MEKEIRVVVREVGKDPEWVVVPNELKALQGLVGGYVEAVDLGNCVMLVDEEGKIKGKPINYYNYLLNDYICGTAVFVGTEGEEFASLDERTGNAVITAFQIGLAKEER